MKKNKIEYTDINIAELPVIKQFNGYFLKIKVSTGINIIYTNEQDEKEFILPVIEFEYKHSGNKVSAI